jgi:hypothetical protein
MSTARVLPRLGVAVGALLAALLVGSPAFAADPVSTSISGMSSSFTAGARNADSFTLTMSNETKNDIQPIRRIIVVRLPGLTPQQVRISRGGLPLAGQASAAGEVRAADMLQDSLGPKGKARDQSKADYTIQFLAGAPGGKGDLTFQAYHNETLLGSTTKGFTVRGGTAQTTGPATPTPNDTATQSGGVVPGAVSPAQPVAPLETNKAQASTSASSGVPTIFYVLGAVLVTMGGAILWLLFRPRQSAALVAGSDQPTDPYPPAPGYRAEPTDRAPTLGYPRQEGRGGGHGHVANIQPTTVMPAVRDSAPPPPVDPWAGQGGFTDRLPPTR